MMQRKHPPFADADLEALPPLVRAYVQAMQLKPLYRQGWLRRGIAPEMCESVAEHTFGVAMLALFLLPLFPHLDAATVLQMALLHDLGEAIAGDFTPQDSISPNEKHRRERDGVRAIVADVPNGETLLALWERYERNDSPEARFVRQLDRLEMAWQAFVYERLLALDLGEFFQSAATCIEDESLCALLDAVLAQRGAS